MKKAFIYAFKKSIPILISYMALGMALGILMQSAGYNWIWTLGCSFINFAGSLQFLMVSFLVNGESLVNVALLSLLLNSRHIFYGIPFIEKWKKYGFWKFILIHTLTDEAFSIHITNDFDEEDEKFKKYSYVFSGILVWSYWVLFTTLGTAVGSWITFDTKGIDFAMTAMFWVILIEQLKSSTTIIPAIIAVLTALICLFVLGPQYFILPSLLITVFLLLLFRRKIEEVK